MCQKQAVMWPYHVADVQAGVAGGQRPGGCTDCTGDTRVCSAVLTECCCHCILLTGLQVCALWVWLVLFCALICLQPFS
jgi:hypothetical protein